MIKNKKWIRIVLGFVILIMGGVCLLVYNDHLYDREMAKKCIGYKSNWLFLTDCYGVISINQAFDIKGYYFEDHIHNYELAEIDNIDEYKIKDNKIYVKNREPFNCSVVDKNGKEQFCLDFYQNEKMNTNYYEKKSDIPLYLVIETQTGNVTAYKSLDQIPENEKIIFKELEKK